MSWTTVLASLAEVSHLTTLTVVSACLAFMLCFIFRIDRRLDFVDVLDLANNPLGLIGGVLVQGLDDSGSGHNHRLPPPAKMDFQQVKIFARLRVDGVSGPEGKVKLALVFKDGGAGPTKAFNVRAFWKVSIPAFHNLLASPWSWFLETFRLNGNMFGSEGCQYPLPLQVVEGSDEAAFELDQLQDLDLGQAPRKHYPLVVIVMPLQISGSTDDPELPSTIAEEAPAAILAIVHIQDEVCRMASDVLATYHKDPKNGATHLVPIFSTMDDDRDVSAPSNSGASPSMNRSTCVVCQERPVTRCNLPCRHACTCGPCFDYMTQRASRGLRGNQSVALERRCPLCRGFVLSYFLLDGEEEPQVQSEAAEATGDGGPEPQRANLRHRSGLMGRMAELYNRFVPGAP